MHSASVYSVLSTVALFAFTNAVPTPKQLNGIAGPGKFELHCDLPKGRFDGYCSVDPCGRMNWCPDYLDGGYVLKDVVAVHDPPPKNTTITCTDCQNGKVPPPTPPCSNYLPPKVTASCTSSTPSVTISHSCSTSTTSSCTTSTTTSCTTHPSVPAVPPPPPKDECHCKDDSEKPSEPTRQLIFYACQANNFRGYCSVDPCSMSWCPDYAPGSYNSEEIERHHKRSNVGTPPPGKSEYHCQLPRGHFDGFCSVDPCGRFDWCPDYAPGKTTNEMKETPPVEDPIYPSVDSSSKYYRCANNGFEGTCSVDPCALEWCPDYPKPTKPAPVPIEQKPKQFYRCANNGFEGSCSIDPCALEWCPDYPKPTKSAPVPVEQKPKQFYTCANNGFHGMCSVDPCAITWCPDYESRTYIPIVKSW